MPIALLYTDIFGLEIYNHRQNISSYASVNAWCSFITDRCHQTGVYFVGGMTPKTGGKPWQTRVHVATVVNRVG